MSEVTRLEDGALIRRAEALARGERGVLSMLIACLAEIDRRELHLSLGFSNLFEYCVGRLRMSEGAAGRRVAAVRAASKRPEVLSYLRDGIISLSVLCRVEPFLREADAAVILARASGARRAALDELLAELRGRTRERADPVETVPTETAGLFDATGGLERGGGDSEASGKSTAEAPFPSAPDRVICKAPGLIRFSFDAPVRLRDKLERIGDLLASKLNSRRMDVLLEAVADEVLSRLEKPLSSRRTGVRTTSRRIPLMVRREVRLRDAGRCAYRAQDGTRCAATRPLQYDHVTPWALGGRSDDPANIRLLCRAHNLLLARRLFPAAREAARRARASRNDGARSTSPAR